MIKVSIILTTYNSGKTLQETISSVKGQKGINQVFELEWLVVDDCSSDDTHKILTENKIPFTVNKRNSGGPNKGRNKGLSNATGDVICFIDHDDLWEPDKIIKQLEVIKEVPIVSTGYKVIDTTAHVKEIIRGFRSENVSFYNPNETFRKKLKRQFNGQKAYLSTLMIRSEFKHIRFEEHFGMLDFDWLLRLFENNRSAEIQYPLMIRNVCKSNLSLDTDYRKKDYHFAMLVFENYEKKYPKEVAEGIKSYNASRAKFNYLMNEMNFARRYFVKSSINIKNIAYFITSYAESEFIRRRFNVFG